MRFLARRLFQLLAVLLLVTFFTALLIEMLPGDPVQTIAPFADDEQRQELREDLNLDDPLIVRYGAWLGGFVSGDLGDYYAVQSKRPVMDDVKSAMPVSLLLMVYAQTFALAVAIPFGVFSAYRAGTTLDKLGSATAFALIAIPNFVLAYILQYYIGVKLGWLPVSGYTEASVNYPEHVKSMILPTLTLAVGQIAIYMRLLRSDMIATLQEDYITMAKSKGVPASGVLWRHALRPSSLTLLTVAGLNVGTLIGGALIIEVLFQLPGIGQLIYEAIGARQYVALQSMVALIAVGYVIINFFVDLLYAVLDPRIRHARALG